MLGVSNLAFKPPILDAFRANDNAKAADILNKLVQAKKDGHDQYK